MYRIIECIVVNCKYCSINFSSLKRIISFTLNLTEL